MNVMVQENIAFPDTLAQDLSKPKMEVFEDIYKNTSGFVYNVAYRITGNTYYAEEAAQEVFLKIFKNLNKFESRSGIRTWIYRITVNTSINIQKKLSKERKRVIELDDNIQYRQEKKQDELEKKASNKNNEKLVESLLNLLPRSQKECVILRDIEGLSYEEISQTLKININTVRTWLRRARTRLIEAAKKEGSNYGL